MEGAACTLVVSGTKAATPRSGRRLAIAATAVVLCLASGLSGCVEPQITHVADPNSACERLRTSYPSQHGLMLFSEPIATARSIPWCFPRTEGSGVVIGYNVNVSTPRAGTVVVAVTDVTPPTEFVATSQEGTCWGASAGMTIHHLGRGPEWSIPVVAGDYCISLMTARARTEDVWFTLTVTRP